jgi:hypothetical protein
MDKKMKKIFLKSFAIFLMATIFLPSQAILAQNKKNNINSTSKSKGTRVAKKETPATKKLSTSKTNNTKKRTNINSGNKTVNVNVDKSKEIRVNNSRNTVVRHNINRPYARPPYRYGGHRYYCYHPYRYHPYRPYAWGPMWHPWGFFIATLAETAIIISVSNQQYHYDQGVYYVAGNGGYTVVQAPVGAVITTLPPASQTVIVNETTNNYYYGGTFYEKSDKGYTVVPPTAGVTVENLPEGGKEVTIGNQKYVKIGETYYQPVEIDGKNLYEVSLVEADK